MVVRSRVLAACAIVLLLSDAVLSVNARIAGFPLVAVLRAPEVAS